MYFFKEKEEITIPVTCKLCLDELSFVVTAEEYKNTTKFPIRKEKVHGTPQHNLIVFLDKNLQVINFKIEDLLKKEVSYSKEITRQVLSEIELSDDEIKLYFLTTGRSAVSIGEMAILINKTKEECEQIAEKFVEKGLYKKIIGATPHYMALPPYAALVYQLEKFSSYFKDIKEKIPPQLNQSLAQIESKTKGVRELNDYTDFMSKLKENIFTKMNSQKQDFERSIDDIEKIKTLAQVIGNLEDDTKKIIEIQIENLTKKFNEIQKNISQNLEKLYLGVIQKTVEQIIQKIFTAGLENIKDEFNTQISSKLDKLLGDITNKISNITNSATNTGEIIKELFSDISNNFSKSIIIADEKLSGISESIFESLNELRNTFSTQVLKTLEDVLEKILTRLEISEITTKEFWEASKGVSLFTMRDIWFIRSIEGVKAHINDQISKAKMRLLIVAPRIIDIDINSLKAIPKFVNIRIAASIDLSSSEDEAILQELDQMQNVTYRHRKLQNLWGVNKDYEEVVICVVSQVDVGGKMITEIAGIGSIIQEHIKIFVPILEDAWVGAQKDIPHVIPKKVIEPTVQIPIKSQPIKPLIKEPKNSQLTQSTFQSKEKELEISNKEKDLTKKPIKLEPQLQKPLEINQSFPDHTPIPEKKVVLDIKSTTPTVFKDNNITTTYDIAQFIDSIKAQLDKKTGTEISIMLNKLHDSILQIKGYSGVLDAIKHGIASISTQPTILNKKIKKDIERKLDFWKKKLHL